MAQSCIGYGGYVVLDRPQTKGGFVRGLNAGLQLSWTVRRGLPLKRVYWFGYRWPRLDEQERIERRLNLFSLAWPPRATLQQLDPIELLRHLRRVKMQDKAEGAETFVMMKERKLPRYVNKIRSFLRREELSCYFAATNRSGEVISFYRYQATEGKEDWCREWNRPELAGNVKSGCFRRGVTL